MDDPKSEKVALFRYGLIATLVLERLSRGELMRRARELATLHYDIPWSERTTISVGTLLKWANRYRKGGLEALAPARRKDRGKSRVISPQLAELIERLKRENPHRTGTTLLRELALSSDEPNSSPLSAASLYRFLKEHGLTQKQLLAPPAHKKFEAEFANQIWQSDMMFGPYIPRPGGGKQQAMLYAILDDASRLIPHAQFYADEGLESLLDCMRQGVAARGIPVRLYVDNGKVYRSAQLARIAATLGILIVHTPPYQPEGRGKIERVRQLPPAVDARRLFFYRLDRVVRRDSTFLLQNRFYEAPAHLAGQKVEVRFDPLDPSQADVFSGGVFQGAARLADPIANGLWIAAKSEPAPAPEPTGINYVELLHQKREDGDV